MREEPKLKKVMLEKLETWAYQSGQSIEVPREETE